MRKSRFTDEQMVAILREADKTSVMEASKRNKVSEQSIYSWRKHFGGLAPADRGGSIYLDRKSAVVRW